MRGLAMLLLVACSQQTNPAPAAIVGKTRAVADKACACRDASCVTALDAEWNELAKDQTARQLSADDVESLANETQRYAKCVEERRK